MKPIRVILRVAATPDLRLASNQRHNLYWREHSRLVAEERTRALWLLKIAGGDVERIEVPVKVAFKVRFARQPGQRALRRLDADNLSGACKPWLDALTLGTDKRDGLGLLHDDTPRWVRGVSYEVDMSEGEAYMEISVRKA